MVQPERFEVLVLGSGTGGKLVAWHMAQSGRRTAVVERHWIGGSCPNIACMPSKNEISSAKIAQLARDGAPYGTVTGSVTVDMATVRRRKREMVERQVAKHLKIYGSTLGDREEFRQLLNFMDAAQIRPVIDRVFPLGEAAAAQRYVEEGRQFGKVVLAIPGD